MVAQDSDGPRTATLVAEVDFGAESSPMPFTQKSPSTPPPSALAQMPPVPRQRRMTAMLDTLPVADEPLGSGAVPFVQQPSRRGVPKSATAALAGLPATRPPTELVRRNLPPPPRRQPEDVDFDEWASLTARVDCEARDVEAILALEQLDRRVWSAVGERHTKQLDRDLRRGDKRSLQRYDEAYTAGFEDERGQPVDAEEFAALQVAAERGMLDQQLANRRMPKPAFFSVHRLWMQRLLRQPALAARVDELVRGA